MIGRILYTINDLIIYLKILLFWKNQLQTSIHRGLYTAPALNLNKNTQNHSKNFLGDFMAYYDSWNNYKVGQNL